VVRPGQRRRAVDYLKSLNVSERRACRVVSFSRSAAWRPRKGRNDDELRARLKILAERYPKYGYPTLHDMLVLEGQVINRKRTYRIYRRKGSRLERKSARRSSGPGCRCWCRVTLTSAGPWTS